MGYHTGSSAVLPQHSAWVPPTSCCEASPVRPGQPRPCCAAERPPATPLLDSELRAEANMLIAWLLPSVSSAPTHSTHFWGHCCLQFTWLTVISITLSGALDGKKSSGLASSLLQAIDREIYFLCLWCVVYAHEWMLTHICVWRTKGDAVFSCSPTHPVIHWVWNRAFHWTCSSLNSAHHFPCQPTTTIRVKNTLSQFDTGAENPNSGPCAFTTNT